MSKLFLEDELSRPVLAKFRDQFALLRESVRWRLRFLPEKENRLDKHIVGDILVSAAKTVHEKRGMAHTRLMMARVLGAFSDE